jgi:hypothetical protein
MQQQDDAAYYYTRCGNYVSLLNNYITTADQTDGNFAA